jgi:hypothetical protein
MDTGSQKTKVRKCIIYTKKDSEREHSNFILNFVSAQIIASHYDCFEFFIAFCYIYIYIQTSNNVSIKDLFFTF